jgi:cysteine desulfuration protein SufE
MPKLDEIASTFRSVDTELRIQLLLDYARKLPPVPARLRAGAGEQRVHECMTPVYLWIETDDAGTVRLFIDVAEEAPTVKGIAGVLVAALDGAPREDYEKIPNDLLRALGLAALVGRIRRGAGAA